MRSKTPRWTTTLRDLRVERTDTARGPIEFARTGTGPAVLCIHGMPGSWRQLVQLAEDLSDRFDVILPSRPGYGRTPIRVGRTYDEQADAYAALLDTLGVATCVVIGVSGGGPSAAAFASRHPGRTDALLLLCALTPHLITPPRLWRLFHVPLLADVLMPPLRTVHHWRASRSREHVDVVLSRGLTADERARAVADQRIRDDLLRHVLGHQEAPAGVAGLRNDYAQIERTRHPRDLGVRCRTLILHGSADTPVPPAHARFHESVIAQATLQTFEDAGHLFLVTRRAETSRAVHAFLGA
jgi:pimeloyl-ACP methyl ester carboxylesterase